MVQQLQKIGEVEKIMKKLALLGIGLLLLVSCKKEEKKEVKSFVLCFSMFSFFSLYPFSLYLIPH